MYKNHVHIFDKKKRKEVATINGLARNVTYQDLDLPTKLGEMITEYAYTPIDERMAGEITEDDKHHNIMKYSKTVRRQNKMDFLPFFISIIQISKKISLQDQ